MSEHRLLLFLVEVGVVVVAARVGGELAMRIGVPEVVGELVLGICLGPSLLGAVWPSGFEALFPATPVHRDLLEIMSWLGVLLLVTISGLETRLGILRRAGKAVAWGWIGGFAFPFALGFGLGWFVPRELIGAGIARTVFALFLGTAMSISAIPVIARILVDLDLVRTRVGMVILSTAIADDTVGWIVLATVTGFATGGGFDSGKVATALAGTFVFVLFAFTLGQWLVRKSLARAKRLRMPHARTTLTVVIVLVGAAITQAIHVHLVLGAFVAAVLVGRSPARDETAGEAIRQVGMALFVPFFFGYTGIKVDLTTLRGSAIPVGMVAIALACVGKLVGGSLGARFGGMEWHEAWAVGAGLNARGAMELVIAAVGLSIGVLTVPMYSIVVLIAVVTTLMAAPMLHRYKRRSLDAEVSVAGARPRGRPDSIGAEERGGTG